WILIADPPSHAALLVRLIGEPPDAAAQLAWWRPLAHEDVLAVAVPDPATLGSALTEPFLQASAHAVTGKADAVRRAYLGLGVHVTTPTGAPESERLDEHPATFQASIAPSAVPAYDPQATFAEQVEQMRGPFGLRTEGVRLGTDPDVGLELTVDGFTGGIPNVTGDGDRARLFVDSVKSTSGRELVRPEPCGQRPQRTPRTVQDVARRTTEGGEDRAPRARRRCRRHRFRLRPRGAQLTDADRGGDPSGRRSREHRAARRYDVRRSEDRGRERFVPDRRRLGS